MNKKLLVGNLPYKLTSDDLKNLFSPFGNVVDAVVLQDRETHRSRGFGFVEFETDEEAKKAIKEMNGKLIEDRELVVNEARERQ